MIVTVTPNPSVDRTLHVPSLRRGEVVRVGTATSEAGGKGINVARALATEGREVLAIVPASSAGGALLLDLLAGDARLEVVAIAGELRVNVSLVEPDGTVTKVNEPGPALVPEDGESLLARTFELAVAEGARWIVGSGSLPPGLDAGFYARLVLGAPASIPVAVDADGEALRACAGTAVGLLKPNRRELEGLIGRPLGTLGDVVDAAGAIVAGAPAALLVSLGADGAVYVSADRVVHAEAWIPDVANIVGAGDALLAGFLAAGGVDELAEAVAWSVAACRSPGTRMRPVSDADRAAVIVHGEIDRARRLGA